MYNVTVVTHTTIASYSHAFYMASPTSRIALLHRIFSWARGRDSGAWPRDKFTFSSAGVRQVQYPISRRVLVSQKRSSKRKAAIKAYGPIVKPQEVETILQYSFDRANIKYP